MVRPGSNNYKPGSIINVEWSITVHTKSPEQTRTITDTKQLLPIDEATRTGQGEWLKKLFIGSQIRIFCKTLQTWVVGAVHNINRSFHIAYETAQRKNGVVKWCYLGSEKGRADVEMLNPKLRERIKPPSELTLQKSPEPLQTVKGETLRKWVVSGLEKLTLPEKASADLRHTVDACSAHVMQILHARKFTEKDVQQVLNGPKTQTVLSDPKKLHQELYGLDYRGPNKAEFMGLMKAKGYFIERVPEELWPLYLQLVEIRDKYDKENERAIFQSHVPKDDGDAMTYMPAGERVIVDSCDWGGAILHQFVDGLLALMFPGMVVSAIVQLRTKSGAGPQRTSHVDGKCATALSLIIPLATPKVANEQIRYGIDIAPGSHNSEENCDNGDPSKEQTKLVELGEILGMSALEIHRGKLNPHKTDDFVSIFAYVDDAIEQMWKDDVSARKVFGEGFRRWIRLPARKKTEGSTYCVSGDKQRECHPEETLQQAEEENEKWKEYTRQAWNEDELFMDQIQMTTYEHTLRKKAMETAEMTKKVTIFR